MIKIAICDDDKDFLAFVQSCVHQYFRQQNLDGSVSLFERSDAFWDSFVQEGFHIVWLDILLPGTCGIKLARNVFERDRNCVISFISSSPDFAMSGYGVNAVGYLLKPPSEDALRGLLDQCVERYGKGRHRPLILKVGAAAKKLDMGDILFLESRNKQVLVHCRDEVVVVSGKLSALLDELPPSFVQTHKSYVVNLDHIASMNRTSMEATTGKAIPTSRQFRQEASQRYLDHVIDEV